MFFLQIVCRVIQSIQLIVTIANFFLRIPPRQCNRKSFVPQMFYKIWYISYYPQLNSTVDFITTPNHISITYGKVSIDSILSSTNCQNNTHMHVTDLWLAYKTK